MRILYVSQYFPPEIGAPSARVYELSKRWVQRGHEVTVLTGFPNHPTGVIAADYRSRFRRLFHREATDGIDVVRTWLWPLPNRKSWERIVNYSSFALSASLRGLLLRRPDVIIATSPQLLVGVTGWWLGLVKRAPMIFEVRDIWPDAILASGVSTDRSTLARALRAIARFLHRVSDRIVVVTDAFKTELVGKWGVPAEKISVVPNGVETDLFKPSDDPDSDKAALDLGGKFVVAYVGTLGYAHGLETMLEAAAQLQVSSPEITFLLVGEGANRASLEARVVAEGLENVRFLAQQPRSAIPRILGASDISLVLLKAAPIFTTVIPTKMLEFMACGCPVIVGVDGQAREMVEGAGAGIFVEPEDGEALATAIERLREDAELRHGFGQAGRAFALADLSRERTANDFLQLLEGVVRERGSSSADTS